MSKKNKKSRRSRRKEKQEERVQAFLKGFKRDNPHITPPQTQGKTILSYIPSPLGSAGNPCLKCKHKNCEKENKIGGQAYIPYQIYEIDNPITQSKVFHRDPPLIHPCTGEILRFLPDGIMETSGKDIMANLKSRGISMNEFLFTVFKENPEKFDGFFCYAPPLEGVTCIIDLTHIFLSDKGLWNLLLFLRDWKNKGEGVLKFQQRSMAVN